MNKAFGTILILVAIILGGFAVWRGFFYYPNQEDSGVQILNNGQQSSSTSPVSSSVLPTRLVIPKLNIDANVQRLGITRAGNMAAPNNFTDVSWYKYGTVPGQAGSAVMAGHEDNAISLDGVFKHLDQLSPGDDIYVIEENGNKLHFQVVESDVYPYNDSPLQKIFNTDDGPRLNLITCAGHWIQSAKTNDKRLVVYTKLVK